MNELETKLREFHTTFEQTHNEKPTLVEAKIAFNRIRLIQEELSEYAEALAKEDLVEIADALTDLLYVVIGGFVEHGLPLQELFDEVHSSNMSKVGGHKDASGKWIKPKTYREADLKQYVQS